MGIPNSAFNEMTQNKPLRWLGQLLRFGHYSLAVIMILWTIAGPTIYLPYLVAFWPLMLIANYLWGCFLTRWEMRLTGENMTVIDPPLLLFGYDYSSTHRKILTLVIGLVMLLVGSLRLLWLG